MNENGNVHYLDYYKGSISPHLKRKSSDGFETAEAERRPWHQRDNEPVQAYSAFLLFLDMGRDRSFATLADVIYGNPESTARLEVWAKDHEWSSRATHWDRFVSNTRVQAMEEALVEAEKIALRYMPDITLALCKGAAGIKGHELDRVQMQAIRDYMDRFGAAKQQRQAPMTINNFTVKYPELPRQMKERMEIEEAEFEVLGDHAMSLVPEELRKGKK